MFWGKLYSFAPFLIHDEVRNVSTVLTGIYRKN